MVGFFVSRVGAIATLDQKDGGGTQWWSVSILAGGGAGNADKVPVPSSALGNNTTWPGSGSCQRNLHTGETDMGSAKTDLI